MIVIIKIFRKGLCQTRDTKVMQDLGEIGIKVQF